MKISEILLEDEYNRGKSLATKILSPSQWINPKADGNYEKNKLAATKFLSPSQWFKSNKSSSDDEPKEKPKAELTVNLNQIKKILNSVALGEPRYADEMKLISQFISKVKSGDVDIAVDSNELIGTLKSLIKNDQLSADQIKIIKAYADSI